MKLYKYISIECDIDGILNDISKKKINDIYHGKYWFSKIKKLNDPFDSRVNLRYPYDLNEIIEIINSLNHEETEYLIQEGKFNKCKSKEELINLIQNLTSDNSIETIIKLIIRELFQVLINYRQENIGIVCFTDSGYDNILFWSHYANNHSGLCLEIEVKDSNLVRYIDYVDNQSIVSIYDALKGYSDNETIQKQLFFTKSFHWKHESEFRIISEHNDESAKLDKLSINRIFLGCNMNSSVKDYINEKLSKYNIVNLQIGSNYKITIQ